MLSDEREIQRRLKVLRHAAAGAPVIRDNESPPAHQRT